ncbi:hypothetical protein ACWDBC_17940 [Streptomyces parvus]
MSSPRTSSSAANWASTTRTVTPCAYLDHHPRPHSWAVTDPLGDLVAERVHGEVRRLTAEDGSGEG